MKNILITGGCGFIGHHFVEHVLINTNWNIIIVDKLSYSSFGFKRIIDIGALNNPRVKILTFDLSYPLSEGAEKELKKINYIVHMAAETHVDNSIKQPVDFVINNYNSTLYLLEFAKKLKKLETFFYFSTDEVYGPAYGRKLFKENERHNPTNPYSASKSAAEQLCIAYHNTYKVPIIRINVMNAFGERQHVEKFIPKTINNILKDKTVLIHSYPNQKKSGTRFYIHARNISQAVLFLIKKGKIGNSYNLTGEKELSNLQLAKIISKIVGKKLRYKMVNYHGSRPGHDLRYGLDGNKIKCVGWEMPVNFNDSLKNTIKWTLNNKKWLKK